ncbi:alpha/beta hydrolase [Catenisphaera adipataccumulans]|jgi:hypothetical protein|uniref:Phosphoglycolate phosphatase n=1 Tax=Catenisphaera adipataccumulans TaxID=700500 RepID=A0A7W8CZW1_9FIRM|nr:alpha/beta hydrolase [Catenisphaera adipataccumulans]MBB5183020.1 phosphoglycolate phosphatase [Catenisphaera adipataccumulans]
MKLAVFFPGIGYHCDKPLLYYSKKIARQNGYQTVDLHLSGLQKTADKSAEATRLLIMDAFKQCESQLAGIHWDEFDSLLFVEKSIGTAVGWLYAKNKALPNVRHIYFTPVELSAAWIQPEGIVFHGLADPWASNQTVQTECQKRHLPLYTIPEANHSLETGDVIRDLRILTSVMKTVKQYIESE